MTVGQISRRSRVIARRCVDRMAGRRLGTVRRVHTDMPVLALSFDDGPDPTQTPRVLDVLAAHEGRATFFMLLARARRHPALVAEVAAQGHEVALHGVDHRSLAGQPRRAVASVLGSAAAELATIAGRRVELFRPTYGAQSIGSYLGARAAGLACVTWDVDSQDWRGDDVHSVSSTVIEAARPGSIVLLHDGLAGMTTRARPGFDRPRNTAFVLEGLEQRGLNSTTVSVLLTLGAADRAAWFGRPPADADPDG